MTDAVIRNKRKTFDDDLKLKEEKKVIKTSDNGEQCKLENKYQQNHLQETENKMHGDDINLKKNENKKRKKKLTEIQSKKYQNVILKKKIRRNRSKNDVNML